jgi:predicted esterase
VTAAQPVPAGLLAGLPAVATADTGPAGVQPVRDREAVAYVPPAGPEPRRLVVVLHGAGGRPDDVLRLLRPHADAAGLLLLAPASTGRTWDVVLAASRPGSKRRRAPRGPEDRSDPGAGQGPGYGPDVRRIDRCVAEVAARYRVGSYALAGFSDGASYALSLAVASGDAVDAVVAFSPGFLAPDRQVGRPRVFVSHGTRDRVLPVDRCSRRIVPQLRAGGYPVRYAEFAGGHEVPAAVVAEAVGWLSRPGPGAGS